MAVTTIDATDLASIPMDALGADALTAPERERLFTQLRKTGSVKKAAANAGFSERRISQTRMMQDDFDDEADRIKLEFMASKKDDFLAALETHRTLGQACEAIGVNPKLVSALRKQDFDFDSAVVTLVPALIPKEKLLDQPELLHRFLDHIRNGKPITSAALLVGSSYSSVYAEWKEYPQLKTLIDDAQEESRFLLRDKKRAAAHEFMERVGEQSCDPDFDPQKTTAAVNAVNKLVDNETPAVQINQQFNSISSDALAEQARQLAENLE